MPVRVLVTGTNSTVAQSIIKALKASPLEVEIVGCDVNPYSPGLHRAHQAFLVKPYADPDYESSMIALLKAQRIDLMLPAIEGEMPFLADRRAAWERETGTRIVVNSRSVLDVAMDKLATARFLEAHGCAFPASTADMRSEVLARFAEAVGFPLLIKPRRGSCSRHVYAVHSLDELLRTVPLVPSPVVQEYLGSSDEEYTSGVFVDAQGRLKGVATLKRSMANGITGTAIADRFPDVEAEVRRVVEALRPVASCNLQLRRNRDGRPTVFEVNARFSSSVAIRAHFGFNEAEATVRSFLLDEEVPELACRAGVAMRYINEVYAEAEEIQALMAAGFHVPRAEVESNF